MCSEQKNEEIKTAYSQPRNRIGIEIIIMISLFCIDIYLLSVYCGCWSKWPKACTILLVVLLFWALVLPACVVGIILGGLAAVLFMPFIHVNILYDRTCKICYNQLTMHDFALEYSVHLPVCAVAGFWSVDDVMSALRIGRSSSVSLQHSAGMKFSEISYAFVTTDPIYTVYHNDITSKCR